MTEPQERPVAVGSDAPIFEVMRSMRAMRRLRPDPIPDDVLEQVIIAATWAPSANALARFAFVVVTDRSQVARLAQIWRPIATFYRETFLKVAPDDLDGDQFRRTIEAIEYQAEHFAETPAVVVACYSYGSWTGAVRRRMLRTPTAFRRFGLRRTLAMLRNTNTLANRSEAASIYPAVQNLLLAARSLGLAANLTTWHLMAEGEVKRLLGIPRSVHTYAMIPMGWPLGRFGPVGRRPVEDVLHRDRW
jgi:nitroreductase